jgi:hypothetical protein
MKHDHNTPHSDPGITWTVAMILVSIAMAFVLASAWDEEDRLAAECTQAGGAWAAQGMECVFTEKEKGHE